jgi:hypothetical protein
LLYPWRRIHNREIMAENLLKCKFFDKWLCCQLCCHVDYITHRKFNTEFFFYFWKFPAKFFQIVCRIVHNLEATLIICRYQIILDC